MRFREAAGGERLIGHPPTTNKVAIKKTNIKIKGKDGEMERVKAAMDNLDELEGTSSTKEASSRSTRPI